MVVNDVNNTINIDTPLAFSGLKPNYNNTGLITKPPPKPNAPANIPE